MFINFTFRVNTDNNFEAHFEELKKRIADLESDNRTLESKLQEQDKALQSIFTRRQIIKLKQPKKRIVWKLEDISKAISLYTSGARAYRKLLKKGYPFPAVSTLRSWTKKLKLNPGILKEMFSVVAQTEMTSVEKICVISFDEIKIRKVYLYDKTNDETVRPYNYAQVAMLRGLVSSWKQPIFFNYDCKMTKEILFDIIRFVESKGFPVVACVSDLGGTNRALHTALGVTEMHPFFINPANDQKIFVFADIPHLIKLLRNHYLDQGFIINDFEINKGIIQELLRTTTATGDLNIAHSISMEHLEVKGAQRQKVKLATKLFSNKVSKSIERCGMLGHLQGTGWIETAKFFKQVVFNMKNFVYKNNCLFTLG